MAALDFPSSPTVGQNYPTPSVVGIPTYTWDGEKWTTSGNSTAVVAPFDAMAYSGIQINGDHIVSQENGDTAIFPPANSTAYVTDQWRVQQTGAPTVAAARVLAPLANFPYAVVVNNANTIVSPAAGDISVLDTVIEYSRSYRLGWGTATAAPLTISFWVRTTKTGNLPVAVRTVDAAGGISRSYVTTVPVTANVVTYHTVTIPADTAGSLPDNLNKLHLVISFALMAGASSQGTANVWTSSNIRSTAGCINLFDTAGQALNLTGLTLFPGTQGPTATQSPFLVRSYDQELIICERYYRKIGGATAGDVYFAGYGTSAGQLNSTFSLDPSMRVAPTVVQVGTFTNVNVAASTYYTSAGSFVWQLQPTAIGQMHYHGSVGGFVLDARM